MVLFSNLQDTTLTSNATSFHGKPGSSDDRDGKRSTSDAIMVRNRSSERVVSASVHIMVKAAAKKLVDQNSLKKYNTYEMLRR